jgi:hypothetical protein
MLKRKLPTMSKSGLMLSPCLAWTEPDIKLYREELIDTDKRDSGTTVHKGIDSAYSTGSLPGGTVSDTEAKLIQHGVSYLNQNLLARSQKLLSEVAVGVNWYTGEAMILPNSAGRNYPTDKGPEWQFGTADIVAVLNDNRLYVGDWKTGSTAGAKEQLKSLAYGLQKVLKDELDDPRPVVISCLFLNEDGCWPDEQDVSETELQLHADEMLWAAKGILNVDVKGHHPGIHCTQLYCDHLAYCPAISNVAKQMAMDAPKGNPEPPRGADMDVWGNLDPDFAENDEDAGRIQAMVAAVNRQAKYITSANKDRIKNGLKVTYRGWTWEDRGAGCRWYKN